MEYFVIGTRNSSSSSQKSWHAYGPYTKEQANNIARKWAGLGKHGVAYRVVLTEAHFIKPEPVPPPVLEIRGAPETA